ncbi:hypothetical protein EDB83DRAFT_2658739 [Lactarius deliciosus]|nr:hypothetical protein EDB83DRAFT_2658739 [Lactarius deliciosus]
MAMTDPMTALLSLAVGASMPSQLEAKLASMNLKSPRLKFTMPGFPSIRTFNISATNPQSLAFDSSSSFLSPDTANTIGNLSDTATMLTQHRAKTKAAGNATHCPFTDTQPPWQYTPRPQLATQCLLTLPPSRQPPLLTVLSGVVTQSQVRHHVKRKAYIEQLHRTVTKPQTVLALSPDQVAALPPPTLHIRKLNQENPQAAPRGQRAAAPD